MLVVRFDESDRAIEELGTPAVPALAYRAPLRVRAALVAAALSPRSLPAYCVGALTALFAARAPDARSRSRSVAFMLSFAPAGLDRAAVAARRARRALRSCGCCGNRRRYDARRLSAGAGRRARGAGIAAGRAARARSCAAAAVVAGRLARARDRDSDPPFRTSAVSRPTNICGCWARWCSLRCCSSSASRSTARGLWIKTRTDSIRADRIDQTLHRLLSRRVSGRNRRRDRARATVVGARELAVSRPALHRLGRIDGDPRAAARPRHGDAAARDVRRDALRRDAARRYRDRAASSSSRWPPLWAMHHYPYVQTRIAVWRNPFSDPLGAGYQSSQAYYALAAGGLFGTGLNARASGLHSRCRDRLRIRRVFRRVRTARRARDRRRCTSRWSGASSASATQQPDLYAKLLGAGMAATLGFQVFIIIGGVIGLFPLTGITLPFISYGGSSLVANFLLVALVWAMSSRACVSKRSGSASSL